MRTVAEIKQIITPIAARYGVERMFLFGSYARGENTPASDMDFRLDKGDVRGLQLAYLLTDMEDALGVKVDLLPTGTLDSAFLNAIKSEEHLIYERT